MLSRLMRMPRFRCLVVASAAVGIGVLNACVYVRPGHAAIVFHRINGVQDTVLDAGVHCSVPFMTRVIQFSVQPQVRAVDVVVSTNDGRTAMVSLQVRFHPLRERLPHLYRTLGPHYDDILLPGLSTDIVRTVLQSLDAVDFSTRRHEVGKEMRALLQLRLATYDVALDDLSVVAFEVL